jgi:hypothetical protein
MPLSHLLWRLAEGKVTPLSIEVAYRCSWPMCPLVQGAFTLHLGEPTAPKPDEARCPLCRRPLRVLAAKPLASGLPAG